jgi:putative hydrolase of the HAD superfamily
MIKAVLFDFGGVLTEGGKVGGIQQDIAKMCGRSPEEIKVEDLHSQFLRGQISTKEYFEELNRRYPCASPITPEIFNKVSNIYSRSLPVYDLADRLRNSGIRTAILSNMYSMSAGKLRADGYYDGFDPVVLSGDERMAKPDPAFFKLALDRLGMPGNEVLFIDDQERFRETVEATGMYFIVAVSPQQIVADTEVLILKENGIKIS